MGEMELTKEDLQRAFVTAWAAARYRGKLNARSKMDTMSRRTAERKFETWFTTQYESGSGGNDTSVRARRAAGSREDDGSDDTGWGDGWVSAASR